MWRRNCGGFDVEKNRFSGRGLLEWLYDLMGRQGDHKDIELKDRLTI